MSSKVEPWEIKKYGTGVRDIRGKGRKLICEMYSEEELHDKIVSQSHVLYELAQRLAVGFEWEEKDGHLTCETKGIKAIVETDATGGCLWVYHKEFCITEVRLKTGEYAKQMAEWTIAGLLYKWEPIADARAVVAAVEGGK